MPDINPSIPVVGQPDSTEEPKVVTALSQLIAAVNDVDSDQIADGTIALADLATALQQSLHKPGMLSMTAGATADDGWLFCDGSAVSRATYAALFSRIGTAYGAGDGTTTFNLPDLRGRVPMGVDGAAGRISSGTDTLGGAGGEETHLLTANESGIRDHVHTYFAPSFSTTPGGVSSGLGINAGANGQLSTSGVSGGHANESALTAHNNLQPYQVVNYQIKT